MPIATVLLVPKLIAFWLLPFLFFFLSRIVARFDIVTMPQTGNQTSLYNKLVITFVAIGGTVSISCDAHVPTLTIIKIAFNLTAAC